MLSLLHGKAFKSFIKHIYSIIIDGNLGHFTAGALESLKICCVTCAALCDSTVRWWAGVDAFTSIRRGRSPVG